MRCWILALCLAVCLVVPAGCTRPQGANSPLPLSGLEPYGWERSQRQFDEDRPWLNRHHRDR